MRKATDMEYVIAEGKLRDEFNVASTHMLLVNADVSAKDVRAMTREMEEQITAIAEKGADEV